jgi:S-methylmethionine-dependent homocysteine/selenocysteine methylase/RimJ/RimL family protein N-acetyltransferase
MARIVPASSSLAGGSLQRREDLLAGSRCLRFGPQSANVEHRERAAPGRLLPRAATFENARLFVVRARPFSKNKGLRTACNLHRDRCNHGVGCDMPAPMNQANLALTIEAFDCVTARTRVVRLNAGHRKATIEHEMNAQMMIHVREPRTWDEACQHVDEWLKPWTGEVGSWLAFAIEKRFTEDSIEHRCVGMVALRLESAASRIYEIGYRLHPAYHGQGLVGEACVALIDFLFSTCDAHKIVARCNAENHASERVMQKLGMVLEGRLREHEQLRGNWHDELCYGLLANDRKISTPRLHSPRVNVLNEKKNYLTLGGLETFLSFHHAIMLREFSAFELLLNDEAYSIFEREFLWPTADLALELGYGLFVDCLVWRAAPDFMAKLGYLPSDVLRLNQLGLHRAKLAMARWLELRGESARALEVIYPGSIGPRGDAYKIDAAQEKCIEVCRSYHRTQIGAIASAGFDLVCAFTMTSAIEAVGIVEASRQEGLPIIVSATLETDGRLPDGTTLRFFIEYVDASSAGYPLGFMVNCAHPTHLLPALAENGPWLARLLGFRANASTKSHAELDRCATLDAGDALALGEAMAALQRNFNLRIIGGCCGTDLSHIASIARSCRASVES